MCVANESELTGCRQDWRFVGLSSGEVGSKGMVFGFTASVSENAAWKLARERLFGLFVAIKVLGHFLPCL